MARQTSLKSFVDANTSHHLIQAVFVDLLVSVKPVISGSLLLKTTRLPDPTLVLTAVALNHHHCIVQRSVKRKWTKELSRMNGKYSI